MTKRILATSLLGAALLLGAIGATPARADDFCYTGWRVLAREADGECDRVFWFCDMTSEVQVEYHCGGGDLM